MMKSNSLTNRILAFALTLVMILGMLPSGLVSAEEATGTTIYFDPLDEWVAAGYTFALDYVPSADEEIFFPFADTNGDGIYEVTVSAEVLAAYQSNLWTSVHVYEDGKSGWDHTYLINPPMMPTDGSNLIRPVGEPDGGGWYDGEWGVYTPGAVTPPAEPEVTYAAQVGETKYETLEAALAAAESGATVTLLSDITAAGPITIAKDITLNLNGFTLTLPDHNNYAIVVKDSLTINGEGNVIVEGLYGIGLSTTCTGGLTVNGGNITGANADYLIGAFNGKVTINDGTLTAAYCVVNSFDGYNAVVEINGGTLSAELPVLGINTTVSDNATLNASQFLCVSGGAYYNDLATAIAEAAPGSTITLLSNGMGPGAVINKNITIDFGGFTYTFTEGVGSTGTESNGFQILAGSNVTLKNGKLDVAEAAKDKFYTLIQNYADLTVSDMTLDGTNLDKWSMTDGDSYTLSINSGNVTIENTTIIANNDGDKAFAFDVCQYQSYAAPNVTFKSGNVQGNVDVSAIGESTFAIEGGTFANEISAYVVEGKTAVYDNGKYIVRLNQTGFGFLKNNETIPFAEGLTYTNAVVGGEVDGTVTYTVIEGKDIATVDKNGVLTITGAGTIVVRAEKTGNDDYAPAYAAYALTVTKGASSITTEKTHVDLVFGVDSYQMPIETVGDGVVSYTISDTDVAVTLNPVTGELTFDDTVDKVGSFTVTISMAEGDNYSAAEDVSYTVTLSYAETSDVLFTLSPAAPNAKGWYNEPVYLAPAEGYQFCLQVDGSVSEWHSNGIEYTDGVYENIVIYLKDAAGNITAPVEVGTLKIDSVQPDVAMEIVNAVWKTISEKIFFITNKDVTVKVTVSDATSDIEEVQISIDSGETFSSLGNHAGEYLVTLKAEHRDAIEVKVVDKAGMENTAKSEGIIVVDQEKPGIQAEFTGVDATSKDVIFTDGEDFSVKYTVDENNLDLHDKTLSVTINGTEEIWTLSDVGVVEKALTGEGIYRMIATFIDVANNTPATYTKDYVIDSAAPTITLAQDGLTEINNIYYTDSNSYGLDITVDESLYEVYLAHGVKPVVTVNGEKVDLDWSKPNAKLNLFDEDVYEIVVTYDNLVYDAVTETITIAVDHEVPVIELIHGIEDPDLLVDGTYYTDDENYKLTIHLTEDLYDYYLTCGIAPVVTVNGAETTLTWNHMDDEAVLEAILPLTEDGVYAIAVNYANYLHTAEEKTITICRDTVDPEVTITYRDAEGKDIVSEIVNHVGETVFADAVTAVITVKDVNFDQNSVALTVTPANAVAQTRTYTATWNEVSEGVWECLLVLDVAADYVIEFNCQDYANNANSASAKLAVDIDEVPDNFKFAYSTSVRGEILENLTLGFWRNQLTVTVDVVDDISGVAFFTASYSVAEDAYKNGNVAGAFERDELKVLVSEKIINGYRVTFLVPKEMLTKDNQVNGYITLTATDYADNSTTVTDGVRMIVDNIDPTRTVELTAPVNQTETVKYYNGNIVLRANIFEANYRFYDDAVVSIVKDGKAYGLAGHVSGWLKGDANAINTITLNEDGDYVVTITYTDGSGNKMADYSSGKMTLDTIAPVITVNNIKQNSANKDETYGFTITVSDINLDAETVQPKLTAVVKGEDGLYSTKEIELGDAKLSADGTTVTYTVENLDEDALYTLTCSAEDMSNNLCNVIQLDDGKTYETVNFSINRNGSTFGFGTEYMTELVNQYYVYSVYEDLVIVEVNVDPIENYIVTVNGEELVEGTHFTTEQTSNPGEWSIRTYTIDKSYFAEEGEYNVIVTSTDKAETTAYSDIKNLAIAFVVDQTAPVLTISGLQTGGRYQTEEQTVTLIPTDEGGRLNTLKVVVMDSDGNPLTDDAGNDISVRFDYSGEDLLNYLSENGDMVTFTIPTGLEHQVQISCTDCAVDEHGIANEYNGVFSRVTVSKNALVIFYANKSMFYGTLGGLAALIILIVVLLKKKKEKK